MAQATEFWVEAVMRMMKRLTRNRAHGHPEVLLVTEQLLQQRLQMLGQEDERLQTVEELREDSLQVFFIFAALKFVLGFLSSGALRQQNLQLPDNLGVLGGVLCLHFKS